MPKYDLSLSTPLMNAAGSLGFAPEKRSTIDISHLGAFVTNPVSRKKRTPARGYRLVNFPGGFLLHTGYPNPGLNEVIRRHAIQWRHSPLPVVVHLLAESDIGVSEMVQQLESVEGVMAIELGIPPDADVITVSDLAQAAVGELPVIVRIPLARAVELARAVVNTGISAVSLGPPRGALPGPDGKIVRGRLYGPSVFPLALGTVQRLLETGAPVIGAGGIYHPQDAEVLLESGAIGVQLDAVLWVGGWR
jgi:dihydroorotate dehydrogenase (NAD+) catalytic subunit